MKTTRGSTILASRHWHEARNIMLRLPDGTVLEGQGQWKNRRRTVTVELSGTMYTTHWNNVVIMESISVPEGANNTIIQEYIGEIKAAVMAADPAHGLTVSPE